MCNILRTVALPTQQRSTDDGKMTATSAALKPNLLRRPRPQGAPQGSASQPTMTTHGNYTVSQKNVPTFKLSVTFSNLDRFSKLFSTAGKRMKFATKSIRHYPPHLRHVATLPWEIKISNFMWLLRTQKLL